MTSSAASPNTAYTALSTQKSQVLVPPTTHLLQTRAFPKTICPSEIARALSTNELSALGYATWRDAMDDVRGLVWEMRGRGEVEVLQRGEVVEVEALEDVRGPIRVRWKDSGRGEDGL